MGAEYFIIIIIEWIQKGKVFSADPTLYQPPPKEEIFVSFLIHQQEAREIYKIGLIMLLTLLGLK